MSPAKRKPGGGDRAGGGSVGWGTGGVDVFVNPYTFVPFVEPGETFRGEPAGHHRLGTGRFLGEVTVRLRAHSPLLLRGVTPMRPARSRAEMACRSCRARRWREWCGRCTS